MKVGGHQFNTKDWTTILDCQRDACYTTQPVELFSLTNITTYHYERITSYASRDGQMSEERTLAQMLSEEARQDNHESSYYFDAPEDSFGNGNSTKHSKAVDSEMQKKKTVLEGDGKYSTGFFRNQTLGRTLMDTILLKNLTFKGRAESAKVPASPSEQSEDLVYEDLSVREEEASVPLSVRSKCMTQLLFLGAVDSLQENHWTRLHSTHQVLIMDVLLSMVDFAASYNSYKNLQMRIRQSAGDKYYLPPPNLMRQGTRIYLTVLNRAITECKMHNGQTAPSNGSIPHSDEVDVSNSAVRGAQRVAQEAVEERMVSFCAQILKEAAVSQPMIGDVLEAGAFLAATLRSPVVVQVM